MQTWSVQYVGALEERTLWLMRSAEARSVNIGNTAEMSVREIAEPLPEDDPKRRCPDIGRAGEILGWEPRVPAEEGLKKTLGWFAKRTERVCEVS